MNRWYVGKSFYKQAGVNLTPANILHVIPKVQKESNFSCPFCFSCPSADFRHAPSEPVPSMMLRDKELRGLAVAFDAALNHPQHRVGVQFIQRNRYSLQHPRILLEQCVPVSYTHLIQYSLPSILSNFNRFPGLFPHNYR